MTFKMSWTADFRVDAVSLVAVSLMFSDSPLPCLTYWGITIYIQSGCYYNTYFRLLSIPKLCVTLLYHNIDAYGKYFFWTFFGEKEWSG
jgi:hypothetical protein